MRKSSPTLACMDVSKSFGDTIALRNISLEVFEDDYVCIVGPSGAGKTTLLRVIAGLVEPTSGDILVDGRNLRDVPVKDRNVAMLFQDYALFPHMIAYDNIAVGLKIKHRSKSEIQEKVRDVASLLGIERLLKRKPRQLSGGERQRVALARAIIREPDLVLLDEPLANLDAELRTVMRHELRELQRKTQRPFIHVTHDQSEALSMSDMVLLLDNGQGIDFGSAEDVYLNPCNVRSAQFIGFPRINAMNAAITCLRNGIEVTIGGFDSVFHVSFPNVGHTAIGLDQQVILGIRPESLSLCPADNYSLLGCGRIVGKEFFGMVAYTIEAVDNRIRIVDSHSRSHNIGEMVNVYADLSKAIFFDRVTGTNLFPGRSPSRKKDWAEPDESHLCSRLV